MRFQRSLADALSSPRRGYADDPMAVTYGNTVATKNAKTGMTG